MARLDSKRSCWTSPKGHHNRWSLMAVVANQAVAFDNSMLTACRHVGEVTFSRLLPKCQLHTRQLQDRPNQDLSESLREHSSPLVSASRSCSRRKTLGRRHR